MSKKVTNCKVFERHNRPGVWTFDGRKIGKSVTAGSFVSRDEAVAAMTDAVNNFNKEINQAPAESKICSVLIDEFIQHTHDRVNVIEDLQEASADNIIRAIKLARGFIVLGKKFEDANLFSICQLQNKDKISTAIIAAVKKHGGDPKTMKKRFIYINSFFKYCVGAGQILMNPLDEVVFLVKGEKVEDARAPKVQPEIISKLLRFGMAGEDIKSQAIINCYFETGMRLSELRALPRKNVNREKDSAGKYVQPGIHIEQTLKAKRDKVGVPKSSNGFRFIPVSLETMKLIEETMLQSKYKKPTDFVFASSTGRPADKHTLSRLIKRVARRSGAYDIEAMEAQVVAEGGFSDGRGVWIDVASDEEGLTWQQKLSRQKRIRQAVDLQLSNIGDFRHFFASAIYSRGSDWKSVTKYMGHHNSQFTEDQYQHQFANQTKADDDLRGTMQSFR